MDPITNPSQLPAIGSPETNSLDFKKTYTKGTPASFDSFELGKDVVALANAVGGTIIVGAQEAASALHIYLPLADAEAKATIRAIEDAVKDRCSPSPVVSTAKIPQGSGYVVAVNVSPFPGQPVGIWVKGNKSDGYGDPSWTFPVRVGTQTKFFRPEQLAMLMSAEYRRIAILMGDIKKDNVVSIRATIPLIPGETETQFYFHEMDPQKNLVALRQFTHKRDKMMTLPLDQIVSVWRDQTLWRIAVRGTINPGSTSEPPYFFPG